MEKNCVDFSRRNWVILLVFGLVGQIAWSVENMYFNLFVYETVSANLDAVTLMVQLSGIVATLATLVGGVLSDKLGNRRRFISLGYAIWGVTVALFGYISPELIDGIFNTGADQVIFITLTAVIVGDCIMTLLGSCANDAAFNAWVTDNTRPSFRGKVEGVLAILPLVAMLIVAGGFGILVSFLGYSTVFLILGIAISASGIAGMFIIRDSQHLQSNGGMRDIFYGFRPSVIKAYKPLYISLVIMMVYGVACQIFMPYLIIYMTQYLRFGVVEYSIVFGLAIAVGAVVNIFLGRLSDRHEKPKLLYIAVGIMSVGLIAMYFSKDLGQIPTLILFGFSGLVMISGYIFVSALTGAMVRDYTPPRDAGKLQGVRMIFSVLVPMMSGPLIGNTINKIRNVPYVDAGADAMTTEYIPAPEIFLVAGIVVAVIFALVPWLCRCVSNYSKSEGCIGNTLFKN